MWKAAFSGQGEAVFVIFWWFSVYFLFLHFMEGCVYCLRFKFFFIYVRVVPFLGCEGVTVKDKSRLKRAKK